MLCGAGAVRCRGSVPNTGEACVPRQEGTRMGEGECGRARRVVRGAAGLQTTRERFTGCLTKGTVYMHVRGLQRSLE